jgi:hypothetical protein
LNSYENICQNLSSNAKKIRVISHERLSGNPHSSGFDSSLISQRIYKTFPNSKILIVIREQTSWILSNYFQYLSIGGTHSLRKYLNLKYDGKRPGFSPSHIKYHYLIKHYYDRFGKDNVLVLPYELLNFDRKIFLKSLGNFLETDLSNETPNFDLRVNTKSNHYLNYKLRILNPLISPSSVNNNSGYYNSFIKNIILSAIKIINLGIPERKNESFKMRLKKEVIEWADGRFHLSNQITQEIIGINLEEFGYKTSAIPVYEE